MQLHGLWLVTACLTLVVDPPTKDTPPTPAPEKTKVEDEKLRQELLRRMEEDQAARKAMLELMKKHKVADPEALKIMDLPAVKKLEEIDRRNTARMKEIVDKHGWPGKTLVGTDAAHAAWLLVQHGDHDLAFQKRCLALLAKAVQAGEASAPDLAYLTDRVRVAEKKKQVYGTQLLEKDGKLKPQPIEDEANVDKRRREVGLPPLAEYLKFAEMMLKESAAGKP
jgi:hypothetical protein